MAEPIQITAFRQLIQSVVEFVEISIPVGEPVHLIAMMVKRAFDLELNFIVHGILNSRPDEVTISELFRPVSKTIEEIQDFRDSNRHVTKYFNHLSAISESCMALNWVNVRNTPVQFVRDMKETGEYFGNRALSANKTNRHHMEWMNKWNGILKGLEQYVKDHHLTGFAWGSYYQGPGLPPPPPPPRTYSDFMSGGDDRHALLNDINQGMDIVRRLRPVRRDPVAQAQVQPPATAGAGGAATAAAAQPAVERIFPPKFYLEGRKWRIEHQKDNLSLVLENDDMSQSLAMFKCQNVGLDVRNKMNGVTIDNCKRSVIVLKDIISSVELIRCERVQLQCNGHVPLISLDNCDSVQIFLTDNSLDAEMISSKCSSLNVCLLAPDGDYTELAVPEQIKTVVVGRKLLSTVVEKM